ncbi:MAG: signal recognition particle-docking protein FtsY [Candidatus Neomarinimicrobiota bacterium]|nr:MAG: signal recognition particle-docking protein FtsY [Candidatus Neomarinimicrobiota bacterium]
MNINVKQRIEEMHSDKIVTISNIISIIRAALVIPIIYSLKEGRGNVALLFIIIAIISDMLDGWLARISKEITELGKILDPVADKIVIFGVMLYLFLADLAPLNYFIFLLIRDITISLLGVYMLNNCRVSPRANRMGKVSIIFTSAAILSFIYSEKIGQWKTPLIWVSIIFMSISWVQYCQTYIHQIIVGRKELKSLRRSKLRRGLSKTKHNIASRLPLLGKLVNIDKNVLNEVELTLLTADVGVELTEMLVDRLRTVKRKEAVKLRDILKDEIKSLITEENVELKLDCKPHVVLFVGVNGTGKTTTIGKLSWKYAQEGRKVLTVSADTFRAAAYDQLEIWSKRAGVEFMGNPQGKDPSAIAFDAMKSAVARQTDIVLIDTAGRLHTKFNLMQELAKIKRVISKALPGAPHDIWLIIDATTGQNGIVQAQEFLKDVGVTGIILTKLDGTAKGGIVLSIHHKLNIPIRYLGVGEKIEDLIEFEPDSFVEALLSSK